MKRFDEGHRGMLERVDGEWVLYTDHCEAMKRIAGEPPRQMVADSAGGAEPVYDKSVVKRIATQMGWAPPGASPAALTRDKEAAYNSIDRFLRNNMCDEDYAQYSAELDSLLAAQPPAAAEAEKLAKLRKQIAAIPDRIEAISGQHFSYIKRAEVLDTIDAAMQKEVHDGME